ncbi:mitotic checkpoint regulator, MAD2B-interacting-domain-containing protein [Chytriomyces sp. MP71]|nr:mitotic checkpoint regulator, MAD2B-interacting-domain-containing protein [Chytriomyces sp. MP71]
MDNLVGYGSESDSEDELTLPAKPSFLNLPAPKAPSAQAPVLPPPRKKTKTIVLDALPTSLSDDEDDLKPTLGSGGPGARSGLFVVLPPPKALPSAASIVPEAATGLTGNTRLVPANVRRKLAPSPASSVLSTSPPATQPDKEPMDSADVDSFFTFDLPKRETPTADAYQPVKPRIHHNLDVNLSQQDDAQLHSPTTGPSSSAAYAYSYSSSASSSYIYNPATAYEREEPEVMNEDEPLDTRGGSSRGSRGTARTSHIHLDEAALHQLGHRGGKGATGTSVQVVDLNHEDQLGGESVRMENIKKLSRERVEKSAYEHLKPTKLAKAKHSIMALAFEAKAREQELKEAYADRRQAKSASQNKYGF